MFCFVFFHAEGCTFLSRDFHLHFCVTENYSFVTSISSGRSAQRKRACSGCCSHPLWRWLTCLLVTPFAAPPRLCLFPWQSLSERLLLASWRSRPPPAAQLRWCRRWWTQTRPPRCGAPCVLPATNNKIKYLSQSERAEYSRSLCLSSIFCKYSVVCWV